MIYQGILKKKVKKVHLTSQQRLRTNKTPNLSIIEIMMITEHFHIGG